jgi:hypothetical protein
MVIFLSAAAAWLASIAIEPASAAAMRYRISASLLNWRHCEEPTGRANARPMTGSATKQSIFTFVLAIDCFAPLAMTT